MRKKAVAVHAGAWAGGTADKDGVKAEKAATEAMAVLQRARRKAAARNDRTRSADDNRRQVLYWRLLARLFDHEEQAALESASLAIVADIGLPAALLDPQVSVDSIVQRHPELAAEFDGLMAARHLAPTAYATGPPKCVAPRWRRRCCSTSSPPARGAVTAGQLARWQSDAGWLERALGCRPGELRGGRQRGTSGASGRCGGHWRAHHDTRPQPADPGDWPGPRGARSRSHQADAAPRGARRPHARRAARPRACR